MNIIQNIINTYKTDPIKFLMIIALIYLILKSMNIIEGFIPADENVTVDFDVVSKASTLIQKWEDAIGIDNDGNVTLKNDLKVNGFSNFNENIMFKKNLIFIPLLKSSQYPNGTYAMNAHNYTDVKGPALKISKVNTSGTIAESPDIEINKEKTIFNYDLDLDTPARITTGGIKYNINPNRSGNTNHKDVAPLHFGSFGSQVDCPENKYTCGVRALIENPRGGGRGNDDRAMAAMEIKCCAFNK